MTDRAFQGGGLTFQSNAFQATGLSHYAAAGALTFTGTVVKKTKRPGLAGALTFTGAVVKKTKRALTGALTFVGSLVKKAKKVLAGALTFVGGFFGRRLRAWVITLVASPDSGVLLDVEVTYDVELTAAPSFGVRQENV